MARYRRPMPQPPPPPNAVQDRPAAVLLDLDGTLVDTVGRRVDAWLEALGEAGLPATRNQVAPLIGSDGRWLARRIAEESGILLPDERAEAIDQHAGELFQARNVDPTALPGARDLLLALDRAGIPWAIATSSRRAQVGNSIDALHLPHTPPVVDGTHVDRAKPEPDLLLLAAEQLGVDPGGAWCVGDSTFDMQAAVSAGMHPIGVTSGAVGAPTLLAAGAAEVVDSLAALIPRVQPHA